MRLFAVAVALLAVACGASRIGAPHEGTAATDPSAVVSASPPPIPHVPLPVPADAPLVAKLLDTPAHLEDALCKRTFVAAIRGTLDVDGRTLRPGDVLVARNAHPLDVAGKGTIAFAEVPLGACVLRDRPSPELTVVPGGEARELSWGHGTMHARLDVERERAPEAYMGRLGGTAHVAEHAHAGAWEILFVIDAAGTFTLDGTAYRLAANDVLFVPAGAKHAWTPDPGSTLSAIQMYVPPGPEQRFRALAEVDAGR